MKILELTDALKYGLIGFGAILAILCFYLILREQNRTEPRKQILNSVYVFMAFSLAMLLTGLAGEVQKNTAHDIPKSSSGFKPGALDGQWNVTANDTPVHENADFKKAAYHYTGDFSILQEGNDLIFDGFLDRYAIGSDKAIVKRIKFTARGPMNNNYVGAQYYFNDDQRNGFGTLLIKFNNDASKAESYFLFRPTTTDDPFGLIYAQLARAE